MGFIKTLASVVCLAWLFIASSSNSQELTTGQVSTTVNLVQPTIAGTNTSPWVNGVYQGSLTCFAWGNPGYCGPNPITTPGYNINFSFGSTDIYQVATIANVLPNSGSGLRIDGYNFGFTAKNGNGWDNGQTDILYAYVQFNDPKGATLVNHTHSLNYKFNWTNFNYNYTFTTPYASKDVGTVRYGFIGQDTNFWAGPYGPEVTNINFSLKYSVDPCSVNVLSSPNCPGYLDALNTLSPKNTTNETPPTIPNATVITTAPSVSSPISTPTDSVSATTVPTATTTVAQPVVSSTTASASVTPTATNPQPKVGEVTVSGSPAKTISTSQILAIVRNEQSRISNLEQSTSEQAISQAQSAANAAVSQSQSISAATMQQSQSQSQAALSLTISLPNVTNSASFSSNVNNNPATQTTGNQQSNIRNNIYSLALPSQASNYTPSVSISPISILPRQDTYKLSVEENTRSEGMKFNGTDFIANAINSMPIIATETRENKSASVNQQTQDNDLAGGISIASIARQPVGFDTYSQSLKDVAFYAPKEIYRNQNVVDNARAQRGLQGGSDRLHQEMVDSQYRR